MVKTCVEVKLVFLLSILLGKLLLHSSDVEFFTALFLYLRFFIVFLLRQVIVHPQAKILRIFRFFSSCFARSGRVNFVQMRSIILSLVGVIFAPMILPVKALSLPLLLQELGEMLLADLQIIAGGT